MLVPAILVTVALLVICLFLSNRPGSLDRAEIRLIRHVGDKVRREQSQPFD